MWRYVYDPILYQMLHQFTVVAIKLSTQKGFHRPALLLC